MFSRSICLITGCASGIGFDSGHPIAAVCLGLLGGWFIIQGESIWQ